MVKYNIECTDIDGDKLKLETENGIASLKESKKFTIPVSGDKLKRLSDAISGISVILADFQLKSILIEKIEE